MLERRKHHIAIQLLLILFFVLFLFSPVHGELTLESAYPTLGLMGQDMEVMLSGTGFDANTRVLMHPDYEYRRAIIGSVDTPGSAEAVTVVGDTAYVLDYDSGLQVIDVSIPL